MFDSIKKMFGSAPSPDFSALVRAGAVILDVRTSGEFQSGHIPGSINIPLDKLESRMNELTPKKVLITCCASGMRSARARQILKMNGFTEVYNGGGWMSLRSKL